MNKVLSLIIISFAILYLVSIIDFDELIVSLFSYSFYSVLYVVVVTLLSFFLFTIRWQILTSSTLGFYNSYKTNLIVMAINQILPARAGDIYKPIYLRTNYGIKLHNSISSLVLERILDLAILFIIGLIVLFDTILIDDFNFLFPILLSLFVCVFIFLKYAKSIILVIKLISNKKIRNFLLKIILSIYKTKAYILFNSIYMTMILYLFYIVSLYGFIYLFTEFNLSFLEVMIVFVVSALGMSLPSTPASIGVYEATIVFVLAYFGINNSEALSFAIVYHIVQIITIMLLWLFFTIKGEHNENRR